MNKPVSQGNAHTPPSFSGARADLPDQRSGAASADALSAAFEKEQRADSQDKASRRESFMVKRQKPQPVLRPAPELALDSDRAAFNAQWDEERRDARQPAKADRKTAFKEMRRSGSTPQHALGRTQNFNRQSGQ